MSSNKEKKKLDFLNFVSLNFVGSFSSLCRASSPLSPFRSVFSTEWQDDSHWHSSSEVRPSLGTTSPCPLVPPNPSSSFRTSSYLPLRLDFPRYSSGLGPQNLRSGSLNRNLDVVLFDQPSTSLFPTEISPSPCLLCGSPDNDEES